MPLAIQANCYNVEAVVAGSFGCKCIAWIRKVAFTKVWAINLKCLDVHIFCEIFRKGGKTLEV